jgi:hypothetical protein
VPKLPEEVPQPETPESRAARRAKLPVEDPRRNPDVAAWITELASPTAAQRAAAVQSLIAAGPRVMPKLHHALLSEDREVRLRAEQVAQALERRAIAHLKRLEKVRMNDRHGYCKSLTIETPHLMEEDLRQLPCLYRLEYLRLASPTVDNDSLRYVGQLASMSVMTLQCRAITDDGLHHLAHLGSLESLSIYEGRIVGSGVGALAGAQALTTLSLIDMPLEDEELARGITELSAISLNGLGIIRCPITDASLPSIARLKSVTSLVLTGTNISDGGLRTLSTLPHLETLQLWHTGIGDAGVAQLIRFPSLKVVALGRTKVTCAGCARLRDAKNLRSVAFFAGRFTASEAKWLRSQLPDVYIRYSHATVSRPN